MANTRARKSRARTAGEDKSTRRPSKQAREETEQLSGGSTGQVDERHSRRFEAPSGVAREIREVEGHDERVIAASRNGGDEASRSEPPL